MRTIIGIILMSFGMLIAIFGSYFFLVLGIWDLIQSFQELTFWIFVKSLFLILFREIIAIIIGGAIIIFGFFIYKD